MARNTCILLALLALSAACRAPSVEAAVVTMACPRPQADTTGWVPVTTRRFVALIPATFARGSTSQRCFHGGESFRDGAREFEYCSGGFDRVERGHVRGERVVTVGRDSVLVYCYRDEGRVSIAAIRLGDSVDYVVYGVGDDDADLSTLHRVVLTARRD